MKKTIKKYQFLKKNYFAVFCCFLLFFAVFFAKSNDYLPFYSKNENKYAFKAGEELKYKISYGKSNKNKGAILAGFATLSVQEDKNGRWLFKAFGGTTKLFSLFMKVNHRYESIVDKNNLDAVEFKMNIQEGKRIAIDSINFTQNMSNSEGINDIVSILYKLRANQLENIITVDTLFFSYYYGQENYESYITNKGPEIINTRFGKMETIKWSPLLEKGRVFRDTTGAYIWTSQDAMNIPLKLEIPIRVGSIYVNLISTKGTIDDLNK